MLFSAHGCPQHANNRLRKVRSLCPAHVFDDHRYTYSEETNETFVY